MMFTDTVGILDALDRNNAPVWTYTPPQYAHRNGETDAPIEPGQYWFRGQVRGYDVKQAALTKVMTVGRLGLCAWCKRVEVWLPVERFAGNWYGPVLPPWGDSDDEGSIDGDE